MNEKQIQELLELMEWRVRRYTSNESTSVSNNKAKELLNSALYCMNESGLVKRDHTLKEQFKTGLEEKKKKVEKARKLYRKIEKEFLSIENRCYKETLVDGMPAFFKWYDLEFSARDHILTLDYPLYGQTENECGIDLIYEYLTCFALEQQFLSCFGADRINVFMEAVNPEYREGIFNLSEEVLKGVLICEICGEDILRLEIGTQDEIYIKSILAEQSPEDLVEQSLRAVIRILGLDQETYTAYFGRKIKQITFELKQAAQGNTLDKLIPCHRAKERNQPEAEFTDGKPMEDESLRAVIEEIRSCANCQEKLNVIRQKIKSMKDLKEILELCFHESEVQAVFRMLGKEEMDYLLQPVFEKIEWGEELLSWEKEAVKENSYHVSGTS